MKGKWHILALVYFGGISVAVWGLWQMQTIPQFYWGPTVFGIGVIFSFLVYLIESRGKKK